MKIAKRYTKGRLPTEAEWEYAARAGSTASRYGALDSIAWNSGNSEAEIHPVEKKEKNLWNLHDMLGNVWKWLADWYKSDCYQPLGTAQQKADPKGPPSGTDRVVRGGGWVGNPSIVRLSDRGVDQPENRNINLGIRCAREVIPPLTLLPFFSFVRSAPQARNHRELGYSLRVRISLAVRSLGLYLLTTALASPLFAQEEDRVKPLLVMLTAEFDDGGKKPGAGIIFAHRNNRLYVATALHVVRQNANAPKKILARVHWLTGEAFPATLAEHADSGLDLAVLIVDSTKLNVPKLPFEGIAREAQTLKRKDDVFPMGFPDNEEWYSPPDSDKLDRIEGDTIRFQAKNLRGGYSGGGLFDAQWRLVGMLREDNTLNGRATSWDRLARQLRVWRYTVDIGRDSIPSIDVSPPKPAELSAGEVRLNRDDGLPYVWIPPGAFTMGCSPDVEKCDDDEKPVAGVRITKGFWMGQTEVTVEAYRRFASAKGIGMPPGTGLNPGWKDGTQPIANVSWDDAKRYCEEGAKGRLPTEAEWEYAARAGSTASRYGELDKIAWHSGNSSRRIHPVEKKEKNLWNLYDMLGNVWEWVADWYKSDYYQGLVTPQQKADPKGPPSGTSRVVRGGGWDVYPSDVRLSNRGGDQPEVRSYGLGIRCAREVISR